MIGLVIDTLTVNQITIYMGLGVMLRIKEMVLICRVSYRTETSETPQYKYSPPIIDKPTKTKQQDEALPPYPPRARAMRRNRLERPHRRIDHRRPL